MSKEYIKRYYGLDVFVGQKVKYKNVIGVAVRITSYIGVNLDDKKAGDCIYIHPRDENLIYFDESKSIRKMTKSQQNYAEYLRSECDETFAEWMGFT